MLNLWNFRLKGSKLQSQERKSGIFSAVKSQSHGTRVRRLGCAFQTFGPRFELFSFNFYSKITFSTQS